MSLSTKKFQNIPILQWSACWSRSEGSRSSSLGLFCQALMQRHGSAAMATSARIVYIVQSASRDVIVAPLQQLQTAFEAVGREQLLGSQLFVSV